MIHDLHAILQAAHYAAEKHANQKRKGAAGEPYINHLLEVAQLVSSAISEPDPNLVIAALLHDTIEDAGVTRDELVQRFGSDVADLVVELTDDKSLPKAERKRLQIQNAPKKSVRAQIIKLADKIANMRSILSSPPTHWDHERKKQYFEWSKQVIAALSSPNPALKAEFEKTLKRFDELLRVGRVSVDPRSLRCLCRLLGLSYHLFRHLRLGLPFRSPSSAHSLGSGFSLGG